MRPADVPVLPGFYSTSDVQQMCAFSSRQSAVNLLLSGVFPAGSVFRVGRTCSMGYVVSKVAFDRYIAARDRMLEERRRDRESMRRYRQLRDEVKAWALANNRTFPRRGRISAQLFAEYSLAQTGDPPRAA